MTAKEWIIKNKDFIDKASVADLISKIERGISSVSVRVQILVTFAIANRLKWILTIKGYRYYFYLDNESADTVIYVSLSYPHVQDMTDPEVYIKVVSEFFHAYSISEKMIQLVIDNLHFVK